ncbi:hypothetical protein [Natronocalculus amylovorans]|uniref:Uncharacterized protein n=1 Tax=Natronocalculus amylovorans TaxID=2917812 RepID=A0AAE3FXA2_9EURY|nr:hypothetical protein [Natronocalculus amylovorans]MCL9817029.1 hypothetical protein [Natronocalculus amylovorans]
MSQSSSAGVRTRTRQDAPPINNPTDRPCPHCHIRSATGFDANRSTPSCRLCASLQRVDRFMLGSELITVRSEADRNE